MAIKLKIEEARKELEEKDDLQIEHETSIKWASRAAAAFEMCLEKEDDHLRYFSWGDDLFHEALEHAALAEDPTLVGEIKNEIGPRRQKCVDKYTKSESKKAFLSLRSSRMICRRDLTS